MLRPLGVLPVVFTFLGAVMKLAGRKMEDTGGVPAVYLTPPATAVTR